MDGTFQKELYVHRENTREWPTFEELTPKETSEIFDRFMQDPRAKSSLVHLKMVKPEWPKEMILKQHIMCNFTEMDKLYDITPTKINFERVPCTFKNTECPFKGKGLVCIKP